MSITSLIPSLRGTGAHRAVDEVDRLRERVQQQAAELLAAKDEIAMLRWDLTVTGEHQADAEIEAVKLQADVAALTAERDHLAADNRRLRTRFANELAAEANANAITVPPMQRDTSAIEDQATQPIPVLHLGEAAAAGLLGPVLDPGRIA